MKWPDNFPESCPPKDAQPTSTIVYLLVYSPITSHDFRSLRGRQPNEKFSAPELECQAHGLSVFEQINHLKRVRRRVRRLRNHAIGVGRLNPDMGVIKPTSSQFGDSHRTWWLPIEVKPWEVFQVVEE